VVQSELREHNPIGEPQHCFAVDSNCVI